jgi:hypothetical protein
VLVTGRSLAGGWTAAAPHSCDSVNGGQGISSMRQSRVRQRQLGMSTQHRRAAGLLWRDGEWILRLFPSDKANILKKKNLFWILHRRTERAYGSLISSICFLMRLYRLHTF